MIVLLSILGFILFITTVILFSPFRLFINSDREKYYVGINKIASLHLQFNEYIPQIKFFILYIPIRINIFKQVRGKGKKQKTGRKKSKRSLKKSFSMTKIKGVLNLIKIKRFELNFDTGDEIINSLLIAVVYPFNTNSKYLKINYNDINQVNINIYTRLIYVLRFMLKQYLFNYKK